MNRILSFILFLVLSISLYAQGKLYPGKTGENIRYINELKIINENLYPVLDSIIDTKYKVPYYKKSTFFNIWFGLDSIRLDWITFDVLGKNISGYCCDLGIFDYKGNTFFVRGDSIDTTIFFEENRKRKIDFSKYEHHRKYTKDGNPIFDIAELRDVYCSWTYRYINGKFRLLTFGCFDNSVPPINRISEVDLSDFGIDSLYDEQLRLKAGQGKLSDCEFGKRNAEDDFNKQIYIYYSEELVGPCPYCDILRQDYNVNWRFSTDLFPDDYYRCYNEEITQLLIKKYGFDIFKKASDKANNLF
jgi:hypothetical protein